MAALGILRRPAAAGRTAQVMGNPLKEALEQAPASARALLDEYRNAGPLKRALMQVSKLPGDAEALASTATGAVAAPLAGIAGISALAATGDPDKAADTVRQAQEALTYQPRTEQGQANTEAIAHLTSAPGAVGRAAAEIIPPEHPLLRTAVAVAPDAALLALGAKAALRRPEALPGGESVPPAAAPVEPAPIVTRSIQDGAASPEAISRVAGEKRVGTTFARYDMRTGHFRPIPSTVDRVDLTPGPHEVFLRKDGATGKVSVDDIGAKVNKRHVEEAKAMMTPLRDERAFNTQPNQATSGEPITGARRVSVEEATAAAREAGDPLFPEFIEQHRATMQTIVNHKTLMAARKSLIEAKTALTERRRGVTQ